METDLRLKAGLLKGAQPFSIDFGGSALKLAYLTQDPEDDSYTLVKCRSFPRTDLQKALDFIKSEVKVSGSETGEFPSLIMTGVGMHEYAKTIEDQLHIRPESVWEGECFVKAAMFLSKHVTEDHLYHPRTVTKDASWYTFRAQYAEFAKSAGMKVDTLGTCEETEPEEWPILLAIMGSAFVFKILQSDGTFQDVYFTPRGGRTFLGLGSLLTGAKDYNELLALAKEGNDHPIHTYTSDLMSKYEKKDSDTAYNKLNMDVNVFSFGWAPGKSIADFKREDLARAALYDIVYEVSADLVRTCIEKKVKNVVLCGGFPNDPLIRRMMEEEFLRQQAAASIMEQEASVEQATCRTLVVGTFLGAIGALLHTLPLPETTQSST